MSKRHASFPGRVALESKKINQKPKPNKKISSSSSEVSESQVSSSSPKMRKKQKKMATKYKQQSQSFEQSYESSKSDNENDSSSKIQQEDISSTPLISERSEKESKSRGVVKKDQSSGQESQKQRPNNGKLNNLIKNMTAKMQNSPEKEKNDEEQKNKLEQKVKKEQYVLPNSKPLPKPFPLPVPAPPEVKTARQINRIDQIVEDGNDKIKANDNYKPKNFSEPFNILRAMFLLEAHIKPTSLDQIQQKCRIIKGSPLRQLYSHMERLVKNNYVKIEDRNESKIWLSTKGEKFIGPKMNMVEKEKQQGATIKQEPKILEVEKKKTQEKSKQKSEKNETRSQGRKQKKIIYFKKNEYEQYPKQLLCSSKNSDKIKLIINEIALNMEQEIKEFSQKLEQEGSIKFELDKINTNINFFWEVENKILDCFVSLIQHTKTDLQVIKHALSDSKYSNCSKFILIVQAKSEDEVAISRQPQKSKKKQRDEEREARKRKELQFFLFDARAAGFTVFQTSNLEQTFFALRKIGSLLSKKIRNIPQTGESIKHYGPLEKLDEWFRISKNYNQRRVAIRCLKRLRCFSLASMRRIAQKLPTLGSLFGKLVRLDTNEERSRFMSWFLQKYDSNPEGNHMLVNFFFLTNYEQYKKMVTKTEEESEQQKKSFDKKLEARFQQFGQKKQKEVESGQAKANQSVPQVQLTKRPSRNSSQSRNKVVPESRVGTSKLLGRQKQQQRKMYEYESDDDYITKK